MKTLQIGLSWFPEKGGGLDRFYFDLQKHLPSSGVQCFGLVAGSDQVAISSNGRVQSFSDNNAAVWHKIWGILKLSAKIMIKDKPELIVSHFALHTLGVLPYLNRSPLVVHFHGPWSLESKVERESKFSVSVKGLLEKFVYMRARRIIVLSAAFRDLLHSHYGVPLNKISVIPGAVEMERFELGVSQQEARAMIGLDDRPTVVVVRRLTRRMGIEDAITAIGKVREHVPNVQLLIAGRGEMEGRLQSLVDKLDLNSNVRLLGYVPDEILPLLYIAANVSLVPTVALEGFGLITLESLAAGTPVLVTPVGGLPEAVKDLSQSLVTDDVGASSIAERLTGILLGTVALPNRLECRKYVRDNFSWSEATEKIKRVYQEAIT